MGRLFVAMALVLAHDVFARRDGYHLGAPLAVTEDVSGLTLPGFDRNDGEQNDQRGG
jgi:hypothetical protein